MQHKMKATMTGLEGSCDQGSSPCPHHHDNYAFSLILRGTVHNGCMDGGLVHSVLSGVILKSLVGC